MAKRLNWEDANAREIGRTAPKPPKPAKKLKDVHPNSMAARKWKRKKWSQ